MRIIGNKFAFAVLVISILYIVIGYFGWLDTTGYLNKELYYDQIVTGTATEYWRVKLSYYFSITYIMIPILYIITIILYRGSGETSNKLATALRVQLVLLVLVQFFPLYNFFAHYETELIPYTTLIGFQYYYIIISIISVLYAYRKDIKNIKMIATISAFCIALTCLLNLYVNILQVNMFNRVVDVTSQSATVGTPIIKAKVNLFNVEFYNDGLMSVERASRNYKDFMGLFLYTQANKPSDDEIFRIMNTFYSKYEPIAEYKKEKDYGCTKVCRYNSLAVYKETDLKLIDIYKNKGLSAAMNEMENIIKDGKRSLIYAFIKTVENTKNMNKLEIKKDK